MVHADLEGIWSGGIVLHQPTAVVNVDTISEAAIIQPKMLG